MAAALKDRCPSKIDVGPVYNVDPQRRAAYQGEPAVPQARGSCTAPFFSPAMARGPDLAAATQADLAAKV